MPDSEHIKRWLNELETWFDEVGEIVLKPNNHRPTTKFYYQILFDEPFGGAEIPNILSRVKRLQRQGYKITVEITPEDLVEKLQTFHTSFAAKATQEPVNKTELYQFLGMNV
jgi:hypothetical protein